LNGIATSIGKVVEAVGNIITTFITAVGNEAVRIAGAGTDALVKFLNAITSDVTRIADAVGNFITTLIAKIGEKGEDIVKAGKDTAIKFLDALADNAIDFTNKAAAVLIKFLNGMAEAIRNNDDKIKDAGRNLAKAIVEGITGGLGDGVRAVADKAGELARSAIDKAKEIFRINSPSRVFIKIGKGVSEGLVIGLSNTRPVEKASANLAQSSVNSFTKVLSGVSYGLENIGEFNPRITPVLDLTNVQKGAQGIGSILGNGSLYASNSYGNARYISHTTDLAKTASDTSASNSPSEVKFEQNIYSPTALSTNDIYRSTRSQIALAKEELSIP
jgi:hypothetical protein